MAILRDAERASFDGQHGEDGKAAARESPSRIEAARRRQFRRNVSSSREPGHNQRVVESPSVRN